MPFTFIIKTKQGDRGPFSQHQIQQFLDQGKIPEKLKIRCIEDGDYYLVPEALQLEELTLEKPIALEDDFDQLLNEEQSVEPTGIATSSKINEQVSSSVKEESFGSFLENNSNTRTGGFSGLVFFVLVIFPAMEMTGFGLSTSGIPFQLAMGLSLVGGAVSGVLFCPKPFLAGLVGGIVSGPLCLLATYFYTLPRENVWSLELVALMIICSIPGLALMYGIRKIFSK